MRKNPAHISRAQGCLLGQLAGDALGSLVEFQSPQQIQQRYPEGVRDLAAGGTWNTLAGQPTDDSEMALLLARMLVKTGFYPRIIVGIRDGCWWPFTMPSGRCSTLPVSKRPWWIRLCKGEIPIPTPPSVEPFWGLSTAWRPCPPDGARRF